MLMEGVNRPYPCGSLMPMHLMSSRQPAPSCTHRVLKPPTLFALMRVCCCCCGIASSQLTRRLRTDGFPALGLHGDKQQQERDWVLQEFKAGSHPIMLATDVAARGLGELGWDACCPPIFVQMLAQLRAPPCAQE